VSLSFVVKAHICIQQKVISRSQPEEANVKGTKILTLHRLAKIVDLTKKESLRIRSYQSFRECNIDRGGNPS
jgi:hypothetical protein